MPVLRLVASVLGPAWRHFAPLDMERYGAPHLVISAMTDESAICEAERGGAIGGKLLDRLGLDPLDPGGHRHAWRDGAPVHPVASALGRASRHFAFGTARGCNGLGHVAASVLADA